MPMTIPESEGIADPGDAKPSSSRPWIEARGIPAPRAELTFGRSSRGPGVVSVFDRVGAPTFGQARRYAVGIGFGIGF